MMTKTAYYMQMAQEAAAQITGSKEQWTAFLTTSARLYKYPFAEQLMIYKQRPEATACAEYDLWNDRMNRYVKRGSKGIALLDMRGSSRNCGMYLMWQIPENGRIPARYSSGK